MEKIKVLAFMGEAGSGKDTVATATFKKYFEYANLIVSCTTRPQRQNEQEGVDYFFLSDREFQDLVDKGEMLEQTEFNGWHYGTMLTALSNSQLNIGVFNPAGVRALRSNDAIDLTVIRLVVSPKQRLLRQLHREKEPNVQEIIRRFSADEQDFSAIDDLVDYTLVNETRDDFAQCQDAIEDIIGQVYFNDFD